MGNNDGFYVVVNPHVDYAFIVALLMIVNDIKFHDDKDVLDEVLNLTALAFGLAFGMN